MLTFLKIRAHAVAGMLLEVHGSFISRGFSRLPSARPNPRILLCPNPTNEILPWIELTIKPRAARATVTKGFLIAFDFISIQTWLGTGGQATGSAAQPLDDAIRSEVSRLNKVKEAD